MTSKMDKKDDPRDFNYRVSVKIRRLITKAIDQDLDCEKEDEKNTFKLSEEIVKQSQKTLKELLEEEKKNNDMFNYNQVEQVHLHLQRILSNYNLHFFELLEECRPFEHEEHKDPELKKRIKELKFKQSKSYYQGLMGNVNGGMNEYQIANVGKELKQVNTGLIAIFNGLLAIFGTFAFFFFAVKYSLAEPNITTQVMIGFIASLVVAIAELYFIVKIA